MYVFFSYFFPCVLCIFHSFSSYSSSFSLTTFSWKSKQKIIVKTCYTHKQQHCKAAGSTTEQSRAERNEKERYSYYSSTKLNVHARTHTHTHIHKQTHDDDDASFIFVSLLLWHCRLFWLTDRLAGWLAVCFALSFRSRYFLFGVRFLRDALRVGW